MANVVSNGHGKIADKVYSSDNAVPVEPTQLEKISGTLLDNLSPTLDAVQEQIRKHPKVAILSGLGLGILAAVIVRRLR